MLKFDVFYWSFLIGFEPGKNNLVILMSGKIGRRINLN